MTTIQESTNGHRVIPPPFSVENPAAFNSADPSTNGANNNEFPASGYHVPPERFAPKAYPYCHDDTLNLPPESEPLPERCQFMFSDGRQCTMARSDIHPSLCRYHSEREEQLFGDPAPGGMVVGASLDLPELYSACGDLTTAAGVNRALAQVFRLLAQRRISRHEAATFAKLGHLLLQSIRAAHAESTEGVIPKTSSLISAPTFADRAEIGRSGEDEESRRRNGVQHGSASTDSESDAPSESTSPLKISTSGISVHNSPEINTYEIVELKTVQNQHLHKNLAGAPVAQALNLRNEPEKLAMAHREVCGNARGDSSCPANVSTRESGALGATPLRCGEPT